MIHEVDEALRTLVRSEALDGSAVTVVFDAPTREWAAKVNTPTVNLYLYDIREDMRRRERGLRNTYDDAGVVVSRRRPPRYFKLSYLITAWTRRPEDEHRLLSALLSCLLRYDALPHALLTGALGQVGLPVPVTLALPPPEDRSFADVWSALGGELKPSLDLVVSVPVTDSPVYPAGPPVGDDGLRIGFGGVPDHGRDGDAGTPTGGGRGAVPAHARADHRAGAGARDAGGAGVGTGGAAAVGAADADTAAGPDAGPDARAAAGAGPDAKAAAGAGPDARAAAGAGPDAGAATAPVSGADEPGPGGPPGGPSARPTGHGRRGRRGIGWRIEERRT